MSTKTQWPAVVVLCLFSTSTRADGVNVDGGLQLDARLEVLATSHAVGHCSSDGVALTQHGASGGFAGTGWLGAVGPFVGRGRVECFFGEHGRLFGRARHRDASGQDDGKQYRSGQEDERSAVGKRHGGDRRRRDGLDVPRAQRGDKKCSTPSCNSKAHPG